MKKVFIILQIYFSTVLFICFISCVNKPTQNASEAVVPWVISKCSHILVRGDCDGKKIGGQKCQWNTDEGKCEDKKEISTENENNSPLDAPTDEEPVENENNPPLTPPIDEEPIESENNNNPPVEEPVAGEENNPAEEPVAGTKPPIKCSDYTDANGNLEECGLADPRLTERCDLRMNNDTKVVTCKSVGKCEEIRGITGSAKDRCKAQGCEWRKTMFIGKESCHTNPY